MCSNKSRATSELAMPMTVVKASMPRPISMFGTA